MFANIIFIKAVLQEKEKHIEHLLQEREIEKLETAQIVRKLNETELEVKRIKMEYAKVSLKLLKGL